MGNQHDRATAPLIFCENVKALLLEARVPDGENLVHKKNVSIREHGNREG